MALDFSDFSNRMRDFEKKYKVARDAGIVAAGNKLMSDSTEIAPFDKGFSGGLVSTAKMSDAVAEAGEVKVSVSYNKAYAVRLHEDMKLKISQKNAANGKTRGQKYLEKPMKENGKEYLKIINKFISALTK